MTPGFAGIGNSDRKNERLIPVDCPPVIEE